ncbi:MAG: transglycosylase domain-containing protein [Patescibacteria group bacterium]
MMQEEEKLAKLQKRAFLGYVKSQFNLKQEKPKKRILYWGTIIVVFVWLFWGVPLPTQISNRQPISTKLLDRNGKLIYEIYTDKRSTPLKINEIPKSVKDATIAVEDKDFYKHHGFSIAGIARAAYKIVFERKLEGGSTITQQLVKNSLLSPDRTPKRKIQEFFLSMIVESIYTKDQILEFYLNQIPYGGTAYGIEAASELYFSKNAKDLNVAEAAFLAGLPQRPSTYSPFGAHPELAKQRQEFVLNRMTEEKYLSKEDADRAKAEKLTFAQQKAPTAPHFALWIKDQLAEKYGERLVEQGGLRVTTTLDLDLQNFAQEAVATEVGKLKKQKVGNGAALVTKPSTGEILAMVGSKDYFAEDEDGKVNVILAKRQPGSSIKPLNYALALKDEKITAATALADVPTCFIVSGQAAYCPVNYDGTFHGLSQVRFALGSSYNIPAVRVLALNGLDNFIDFATNMGITTFTDKSQYGLSLTLGGGEVRPIDMAQAFGVFANGGIKQPLVSIVKVEDYTGKVLEDNKITELSGERVIDSSVAFLISHILLDNNARSAAFGSISQLNVAGHSEVSVKTGTTNDRRDNWTIGYTKDALVTVWVGNNDNTPMGGAVSGVSGASPIWNKVIKETLSRYENYGHAWPIQPDNVVGATICATTGLLPSGPADNPGCPTRFEYFIQATVGIGGRGQFEDTKVYKDTRAMVRNKDAVPEQYDLENHYVYYDPLETNYCIDCPIASESATVKYPLTIKRIQ